MTEDSAGLAKMTQKWRPVPHLEEVTPSAVTRTFARLNLPDKTEVSTQVQKCQITLLFPTIRYTRLYTHCPLLVPENPDPASNPGQLAIQD